MYKSIIYFNHINLAMENIWVIKLGPVAYVTHKKYGFAVFLEQNFI